MIIVKCDSTVTNTVNGLTDDGCLIMAHQSSDWTKKKNLKKERKCKIPKSELDIFRYLFWLIIHLMASN